MPNALTETITAKTQRVDNILKPYLKIHFIKVDAEGVELQVFRGAIQTLKTHKPYIFFESGLIDVQEWHDGELQNGKWYEAEFMISL